jgi:hypothetical protein
MIFLGKRSKDIPTDFPPRQKTNCHPRAEGPNTQGGNDNGNPARRRRE